MMANRTKAGTKRLFLAGCEIYFRLRGIEKMWGLIRIIETIIGGNESS
jgi:hypothetical protein